MKIIHDRKQIIRYMAILAAAVLLELAVGNWSSWRTLGTRETVLAENIMLTGGQDGGSGAAYCTEPYAVEGDVRNVHVDMKLTDGLVGHVYVVLTDEGDKYEYATPEFTVCSGVPETGYSNLYPFGKVHTIQVAVRLEEGCSAEIGSIRINSPKPVAVQWVRLAAVYLLLLSGCLVFTDTGLHQVCYDPAKKWQRAVTAGVISALVLAGYFLTSEDPVLVSSPWPHHRQYQELAHSLEQGEVELKGQIADAALLCSENPYDTIALQVEGVPYAMDYAFYDGHYYEYFGIVPELLFYYPYYKLTGNDLPNHRAMFAEYVIFVLGAYLAVRGLARRYIYSIPYFFYMAVYTGCVLLANFVYLAWRTDIYNIPIMGAVAFTFTGIGLWLHASVCRKKAVRILLLCGGSLSMALVAGCRPQFLLLSGVGLLLFLPGRNKDKDPAGRRADQEPPGRAGDLPLFTGKTVPETVAFAAPYILVAAVVGWYNYARFGNVLDFGATYSLTTNDMNHRGFNFSRLLRSLYCFWLQPASVGTDFPFLQPAPIDGSYMGKFLSEFLYGGVLAANPYFACIWLWLLKGLKKTASPGDPGKSSGSASGGRPQALLLYLALSAVVISAFDANAAGLLYRYTCDFVPALALAAALTWMLYLDRAANRMGYVPASRLMYLCFAGSLFYTLFSFCAGGDAVCLERDNVQLFYRIAGYFRL